MKNRVGLACIAATILALAGPAGWGQGLQIVPTMQTAAGTGTAGYSGDGGLASGATLNSPEGIAFDRHGNIYISDDSNHVIRKVDAAGNITTAYGTGSGCQPSDACGDGGPASNATLYSPADLAFDAAGDLYIADDYDNRVRRIDAATGNISTVAGSGIDTPFNGEGIAATTANLAHPHAIAIDAAGNLYIAERQGNRVRRVDATTGLISTVAGTGTAGYNGDSMLASKAQLQAPMGIALDSAGDLYIADDGNNRIRRVDATSNLISTVAGNGTSGSGGDGGAATSAQLNQPAYVRLDGAGNIYVADSGNGRVREVFAASSTIATVAGNGTACAANTPCGDGGIATSASLGSPVVAAVGPNGNLYIADQTANRIRIAATTFVFPNTSIGRSSPAQNVALQVAGASTSISSIASALSQGGLHEYTVGTITGCVVDGSTLNAVGTVCTVPVTFSPAYPGLRRLPLIAATNGTTLHVGLIGTGLGPQAALSPGTLSTLAGTGAAGYTGDNGAASSATLGGPVRTTVDSAGNVYVADYNNNVVREVIASTGKIVTVAGNGTTCSNPASSCGDGGVATSANLNHPADVAIDAAGNLYISDSGDNRVRLVNANTGVITTIAGSGAASYSGDGGAATAAGIGSPMQTIVDTAGNLYIAAQNDNAVRFVSSGTGVISTVAGNGTACTSSTATCGDGGLASGGLSMMNRPSGVAMDGSGNLFVADTNDYRIRRIDATTGNISTVAGTGTAGYQGDGGAATSAAFNAVPSVFADPAGDLYIADQGNAAIRVVSAATGLVSTIAGNGTACSSATGTCGDGGVPTVAALISPANVTLDSQGNLYIADSGENRVRKVSVGSPSLTFANTTIGSTSTDSPQSVTVWNIGNQSLTVSSPAKGSNPSISTGFGLASSGSCPQVSSGSSAASLNTGASCTYAVNFSPTTAGSHSGSLQLTDNSLNASNAVQTVSLNGTGISPTVATTTVLTTSQNPSSFGADLTLTATVSSSTSGGTPISGSVTFYSVDSGTIVNLEASPTSTTTSQTLALAAGTYSVSIAGVAGGGLFDGWNAAQSPDTNSRWSDRYGVELCATCTATVHVISGEASTSKITYATAALALAAYQATPMITNSPQDSSTGPETGNPYSFTLNSAANVSFWIPDGTFTNGAFTKSSFGDDTGGVSLKLTTLTAIGTGTVSNGVAKLTTASLPIGTDTLLAIYSGDATYVGSTSPQLSEVIVKATGNDTLTTSNATPTYGQMVTFTDTIPVEDGVAPTGTVTFYNGTTVIGTGTVSSGVATLTTGSLPVGTDTITAIYGGDTSYSAVTSNAVIETVRAAAETATLTTSNASPTYGQSVTFTDTLTIVNGVNPTGTVTFYNGTTIIGTGTVSGVVATLTTGSLPVGTDTITAVYGGDTSYSAVTSNAVIETVSAAAETATLTTSNASPTYGQSVTFTDTLTIVNGVNPTGTVTFYNGTTVIGTGTVSGVVATLTTGSLPVGTDTITAVYGGDTSYSAVTSNAVIETVSAASQTTTPTDFSITATPANQTVNAGTSTTYTVSLAGVNGAFDSTVTLAATGLPTGATVTFSPASLVPGTGPTTTTMTITTSATQASLSPGISPGGGISSVSYGLLLLPLLGIRRLRRRLNALPRAVGWCLLALVVLGATGALSGCGGGYFAAASHKYTINVTGTSGTLNHSASVTLTVR